MIHRSVFTRAKLIGLYYHPCIGEGVKSSADAGYRSTLHTGICLHLERSKISQGIILKEFQDQNILPRRRDPADPQLILCLVGGIVEDIELVWTDGVGSVVVDCFAHCR